MTEHKYKTYLKTPDIRREKEWYDDTLNYIFKERIKEQNDKRGKFMLEIINTKFKWYHKLLFRINKKLISRHLVVQVFQGSKWGVELYGKIYWMP